ncbi:MAG: ribonuclease HII [Candidatus Hydrothermarchaeota archaeon]
MLCGIDEAGRGPVLGDLVIAGVLCREEDLEYLKGIGVKDSKQLSPRRRGELFGLITSRCRYHVIRVSPRELDARVGAGISLNELEGRKFGEIINHLGPEKAYVDCADVVPENFARYIREVLVSPCTLVVEHSADVTYPIVSAASIVAKVQRDEGIARLRERYGEIGSGYPSDPKTQTFLRRWSREEGPYPEFVRRSWKTASRAMDSTLDGF